MIDTETGDVVEEARINTTPSAFERRFSGCRPMRIAVEAGTHSPWVSRLLSPIEHRGEASQVHLTLLRSREALVGTRTKLVNHVRGTVKSFGARLCPGARRRVSTSRSGITCRRRRTTKWKGDGHTSDT